MEWPPDFSFELDRRLKLEHRLTAEPALLNGALLRYAEDPAAFISDCVYIYEPRNANTGEPVMLPVVQSAPLPQATRNSKSTPIRTTCGC